jgi:hypothetical protein
MISSHQYCVAIGIFTKTQFRQRKGKDRNNMENKFISIFLLLLIMINIIGAAAILSNRVYLSHKQQNKLVHILQGNRNSKGYKLCQWNCGSAYLENKMAEIEVAVSRTKPAVFCISESNLRAGVDQAAVQIPGYRLITSKTISNSALEISRVVVYLDNSVKGKIREDLMNPHFSSIWIELGSGEHKLLVGNICDKQIICPCRQTSSYLGGECSLTSGKKLWIQVRKYIL